MLAALEANMADETLWGLRIGSLKSLRRKILNLCAAVARTSWIMIMLQDHAQIGKMMLRVS